MSGLEVVGVVLGAIPLVVSALEHYRNGKGAASSFIMWRGHLDTLIFRLKLQQTFFYLDVLELLRLANVVDLDDSVDLTEEECVAILSDAKLGRRFREYLGPLYGTFLKVLHRYEACLKTIVGKIGRIRRLPNAPDDDLPSILRANPPVAGRFEFAFKERLSFTLERRRLKALLEELQEDRLSLKVIIQGLKSQQEYLTRDPSRTALQMARRLTRVQTRATSLFSALCMRSICDCQTQHSAMAKLECRVPLQKERSKFGRQSDETLTFDLVLPFDGPIFQQALVSALSLEEEVDSSVFAKRTPRVRIASPETQPQDLPRKDRKLELESLCESARDAWEKRQLLQLELAADMLALTQGSTTQRASNQISKNTTLETFLASGWQHEDSRLTPKQQTLFALDIASSMLQFQQTRWFAAPWNSKTIRFLVAKKTVVGVFIEQGLSVPNSIPTDPPRGPDPHSALLELAILLLEIWHHKPFETWAATAQVEVLTEDQRRIATTRWLQATSDRLPLDYLTAVEQCLAICSGRLRQWGDDTFQKYYCENVIKPLVDSCKAWVR